VYYLKRSVTIFYQVDTVGFWLIILRILLSIIIYISSQKVYNLKNYVNFFLYIIFFLCLNLINTFLVGNIRKINFYLLYIYIYNEIEYKLI
jgi:hypothetical protein